MSSSSDATMQDLLDAVTVALQHDDDIDKLIRKSSVQREEIDGLVDVIHALNATLQPVQPSVDFAEQLRGELMGARPNVVARVRQMPARVHIAAILAVIAGFVLIGYRRIVGITSSSTQDVNTEEQVTV